MYVYIYIWTLILLFVCLFLGSFLPNMKIERPEITWGVLYWRGSQPGTPAHSSLCLYICILHICKAHTCVTHTCVQMIIWQTRTSHMYLSGSICVCAQSLLQIHTKTVSSFSFMNKTINTHRLRQNSVQKSVSHLSFVPGVLDGFCSISSCLVHAWTLSTDSNNYCLTEEINN